jgi:hypothetical protein
VFNAKSDHSLSLFDSFLNRFIGILYLECERDQLSEMILLVGFYL